MSNRNSHRLPAIRDRAPMATAGSAQCRRNNVQCTAIKVTDGTVEVVCEGHWKLFTPAEAAREEPSQ